MKNGKKEGRDDWKVRRKWMKGRVEKEKRKREERGERTDRIMRRGGRIGSREESSR